MKKKLNLDLIKSELRGGSAFFPGYKGGDSPTPSPKPLERQNPTQPIPDSKTTTTAPQGVPPPVPRPVPRSSPS
jgi:hypothetical protein